MSSRYTTVAQTTGEVHMNTQAPRECEDLQMPLQVPHGTSIPVLPLLPLQSKKIDGVSSGLFAIAARRS